jgi:hypothetical protein
MIAAHHRKVTAGIWVLALFDVLHPRTECANGDLMFGFTGDSACVTADALAVVNQKAVSHFNVCSTAFSSACEVKDECSGLRMS